MSANKDLKNVITKELLEREYSLKGRTAKDLGQEFGCSHANILAYVKKFGLQRGQAIKRNKNVSKLTLEFLIEEYVNQEKCVNQIAQEVGCHNSHVSKALQSFGIKIKDRRNLPVGEANNLFRYGVCLSHGYLKVRMPNHRLADSRGYVFLHILLAEYYFEHTLLENEVVHHINGDKLDNRKENLQIMNKKDHDRYHTKLRWKFGNFRSL